MKEGRGGGGEGQWWPKGSGRYPALKPCIQLLYD